MIGLVIKWIVGAIILFITTTISFGVLVWVLENHLECLLMKKAVGFLGDML